MSIHDDVPAADPAPPHAITDPAPEHGQRVTWAELFFDLVFAFAVTQVAAAAHAARGWAAVGRTLVLFIPFWWAWVGTVILINGLDLSSVRRHLMIFAIGFGAFVMCVCVPSAYTRYGLLFGCAYQAVRTLLFVAMARRGRFTRRADPYLVSMCLGAPLFILGGLCPMPARAWIWLFAALIEVCTPTALRIRLAGLRFDAAHLPERFGTFVLIALGEALIGAGATESRGPLSWPALIALVLAFTLTCGLWWTYFHFGASALEHALRHASVQAGLVRAVFTTGHLVLVLGLIMIAAGSSQAAQQPIATLHGVHAYFLGVGTALYLLTFCYTRVRMFGGVGVARLVGGVLALAVAAVSPLLPQLAVLGALVLLLIALNVFEGWMVASGRPMALIRLGRGAIPAE